MPTHWVFVWNGKEHFFQQYDFSRVMPNTSIGLGHYGERCPDADLARSFTLVDRNGIHATAISFCRCTQLDGKRGAPEFQQSWKRERPEDRLYAGPTGLLPAGAQPREGLRVQFRARSATHGRSDFCWCGPGGCSLDIYTNFLAISRFYEYLGMIIQSGHAHEVDVPLAGEMDRLYPNRPNGFLGAICAACPERSVNMAFLVKSPNYLRHLIAAFITLDGNYKQNLFFKRDDSSDPALTDGRMHFPLQAEYVEIAKTDVVAKEDTELPCKAHIGSVRHQGSVKYGNVAVTGVVACACDHSIAGSFVDMLKEREHLRHTNSPPHAPESTTPTVTSYDSWCSFVVNHVKRAITLFPEETWLHTLLASVEGQIPADHINGHGVDCQVVWQAVYFACRGHFHEETAEAFLNPLGSSTRQMTAAARHDIINFIINAWNRLKIIRQVASLKSHLATGLSAAERLDAFQLFELHMAVLEDLSRQHATEVADWSRLSRVTTKVLVITLLKSHKEHPLQDTWDSISKLRNGLNIDLKRFRDRQQQEVYPRLTLSALDVDEPELTAIQLPSYHMKHGQRSVDADGEDAELREAEIKLRCSQADNGIIAVRGTCLAPSAVKKMRELDYRGQNGVTRSQRNREKMELMKTYEITMYNNARTALIHLGHMEKDAVEPYRPLSIRDTHRKETHLHRAKGDSRLFDGTAWYLQSGLTISSAAVGSRLASRLAQGKRDEGNEDDDDEDDARLMAGTQMLKHASFTKSQRTPKHLKDIALDDVNVDSSSSSEAEESDAEMSPTKAGQQKAGKVRKLQKKADGWIWLESMTRGQKLSEGKLVEYKKETDQVQWFRAEAEMYCWLEQYERKHAEGFHVIEIPARNSVNGVATFARMQAAMHSQLEHNAKVIFKSAALGAHHDWVSATSFDELVTKIDGWRDVVFKWMDDMGRTGMTRYWVSTGRTKISRVVGISTLPRTQKPLSDVVWLLGAAQPHSMYLDVTQVSGWNSKVGENSGLTLSECMVLILLYGSATFPRFQNSSPEFPEVLQDTKCDFAIVNEGRETKRQMFFAHGKAKA
ncbi:hypothetical protein DFH09DRAFT_1097632 [Mycena vulgaris]|nr:hypothetical protein DFH09DRAFT_1097632 [Mycena vulgaris]